jgi:hypothetical protein
MFTVGFDWNMENVRLYRIMGNSCQMRLLGDVRLHWIVGKVK